MRVLFLIALLTAQAPAQAPAPAPDTALIQRFIDAQPGAERERLAAEVPYFREPAFRGDIQAYGITHVKQGRIKEGVRAFEATIEIARITNTPRTEISGLINLGQAYGQAAEYKLAAQYLDDALRRAETTNDEEMIAFAAANLGNVYRRRGEYDRALETYLKVLAASEKAGREIQIARALNNLGLTHVEQGDYRTAIDYYVRSLAIKERVSPPDDLITTLANIGAVYQYQGNNLQAIGYLDRALALAEKLNNVRMTAATHINISRLLIDEGRLDDAEARLTRALALAERAGLGDHRANALMHLGNVHIQRGRWDAATSYLTRGRDVFKEIGDPMGQGIALSYLASADLERGNAAAAASLAEQALELLTPLGTANAIIDAEQVYGEALTVLGRWDGAIAAFERAISLTERGLTMVAGDAEARMRYLESSTAPYAGLAHAYAAAGRPADALAAAERGRARTLLDMLAASLPTDELSPADREKQIELTAALTALNERIGRANTGSARDRALSADLERLRRSRDEFYLGLDARHPRLRFARGEAPVLSAADIATTLPPRTALVEFIVGPRGAWVLVLAPKAGGEPRLILKPAGLPTSKLLALSATFTKQVATRDLGFAGNARALYDALFGAVDAELAGADQLIVVPHGGLWEVPFQALQTPRGRYLIEERAIAYAPSASALKQLNARKRPRQAQPRVVAFGDPARAQPGAVPLPHAAREVREVAGVYGANHAVVAVAAEATEGRFRQVAPKADIVHIATHGVLDNASPLFSYLMLAGSGSRKASDGRLEGHELINMQLAAELVVLSACETARGRINSGEGVVGLSWALFAAGASTAAVSLWPVDSASTTELMSAFHRQRRRLTAGTAPAPTAQALRASQVAALARPESRHPFYWAGFVVIGVP